MKKYLFLLLLVPLCGFKRPAAKIPYLKPYKFCSIPVAEPSDICLVPSDPTHFLVVSNRGYICELTNEGKLVRESKWDGSDYEGICTKDSIIYTLDESMRRIDRVTEKDFKVKKSYFLNYMGPRNKGFEGLTYVPSEKKFIAVIEKPAAVWELNEQFQVIDQIKLPGIWELSSVTYYNNYLWFLSDEGHRVIKVNPSDYSIVQQWNIPIDNPEGICFDTNGDLNIVSDDLAMLFKFKMQ